MTDPGALAPRKRPTFLLITMLACIVYGAFGSVIGACSTLSYHSDVAADVRPIEPGTDVAAQEERQALDRETRAVLEHARPVRLPLSVADAILSALLFWASFGVLHARAGARAWALQAVVANAALTLVEYVLTRPMRIELASVLAGHFPRAGLAESGLSEADLTRMGDQFVWSAWRAQLAFTMLVYAAALAALLSRRTIDYLATAASEQPRISTDV